jgi:hypothetical protein
LAAALLLVPQAFSDGTLFLVSPKIGVSQDFQEQDIIYAACEDAIKTVFINVLFRTAVELAYEEASPRSLGVPFV